MAFEPSARLVPNNIFDEDNQTHNYQSYQRKKKTKALQDITNRNHKVQPQKQKSNAIKSLMGNLSKPVALQINYIKQHSSDDQSEYPARNSLKAQNRKFDQNEKLIISIKHKRNVLLDDQFSQQQGQDGNSNIFTLPSKYQSDFARQNFSLKKSQKGADNIGKKDNMGNKSHSIETNRAFLSKTDQFSVKAEMLKQEVDQQKNTQFSKEDRKKKFVLQFSQAEQSSDENEQSACVVDEQTWRKNVKTHQQNKESIKINNKKAILLGQFQQESSASQNQQAYQVKENFEVIKQLNLRAFQTANFDYLYKPIPAGNILQCIIRRDKTNKSGKCQYHLYDAVQFKHILTIRSGSQGYQFIKKVSPIKEEIVKIATVKSNFLGTQFNCYEYSQSPKQLKNNLISIIYEANILGLKGPRKMQVFIPNQQIFCKGTLKQVYEQDQTKVSKYVNRFPKWNQCIGAYVLNFKGRATHSSIKNFIIIKENDQKNLVLFGKVGSQVFNLDVKHPFSIVQAAAMTISSFDKKIACQ